MIFFPGFPTGNPGKTVHKKKTTGNAAGEAEKFYIYHRKEKSPVIEQRQVRQPLQNHVAILPKYSVSEIMGYLKGKSSLMIFDRHANLKYKYGNRHFWCRGYYVDTVGKNAKKIEEYVKNQMQEDLEYDQMSLKEYIDPFTGEPVNKA